MEEGRILEIITSFGVTGVLLLWLWDVRRQLDAARKDLESRTQDYIDLLTEIKLSRPVRELRLESDDKPTRPLRSGLSDDDRSRLLAAREEYERGSGLD